MDSGLHRLSPVSLGRYPNSPGEWFALCYNLSKKVAEMSHILHELFVKNHEREVEVEALKAAYEEEIEDVIADARRRLEVLAEVSAANEQKLVAERDALKSSATVASASFNTELEERVVRLQSHLETLRKERTALSTRLRDSQRVAEESRRSDAVLLQAKDREICALKEESSAFRKKATNLERALRDSERQARRNTIEESVDRLRKDLAKMQEEKAVAVAKGKKLEAEVRVLRVEMAKGGGAKYSRRSISEGNGEEPAASPTASPSIHQRLDPDREALLEEIEQLRAQVSQYRLELCNRDMNFTKLFKNSPASSLRTTESLRKISREKSITYTLMSQTRDERSTNAAVSTSASLPAINPRGIN